MNGQGQDGAVCVKPKRSTRAITAGVSRCLYLLLQHTVALLHCTQLTSAAGTVQLTAVLSGALCCQQALQLCHPVRTEGGGEGVKGQCTGVEMKRLSMQGAGVCRRGGQHEGRPLECVPLLSLQHVICHTNKQCQIAARNKRSREGVGWKEGESGKVASSLAAHVPALLQSQALGNASNLRLSV